MHGPRGGSGDAHFVTAFNSSNAQMPIIMNKFMVQDRVSSLRNVHLLINSDLCPKSPLHFARACLVCPWIGANLVKETSGNLPFRNS